ncbi:MAG: ATP-binding protein [Candidatus Eisenbacteria bacterium]|nr:ATP-binding protein [Candidatus Eisenbacteria bacterium]
MNPINPESALEGLRRHRPVVAGLVVAVAIAMDLADPVPGRRELLFGVALLVLATESVSRMLIGRVEPAQYLLTGTLATDVVIASLVVSLMGGTVSPFVLLFPMLAFTGGMLSGVRGGVVIGVLSAVGYEAAAISAGGVQIGPDGAPQIALGARAAFQLAFYPIFFTMVGILSGLLGKRLQESEQALADAADVVEKLRLDTESIIQNLSSALLTIDRSGRIVHVNRVAEKLLGITAGHVRGRKLAEALKPGHRELVEKIETTLREDLPLLRAEVRLEQEGGDPAPLGVSTSLIKDRRGTKSGVVALFQDLTEVRRLEEAGRRQDRLSVIGGMAASIAHEVRNCVNPISGSVEMLQSELRLEGENAKLLDLIGREAAKMERFVSELLNFSRGNPMTVETTTLETILDATLDKVRSHPAWKPTVELVRNWGHVPTTVRVDIHQLEQVFFNLALNALEAMGPVGTLTVTVEPGADDSGCVVEFADTGAGMTRETMDRIFEPFYTTKGSGTGLGLAIAHRIVERHRGQMEVSSRPRMGTRVRVTIPVAPGVRTSVEIDDPATVDTGWRSETAAA